MLLSKHLAYTALSNYKSVLKTQQTGEPHTHALKSNTHLHLFS